jgi:hypothetical protein
MSFTTFDEHTATMFNIRVDGPGGSGDITLIASTDNPVRIDSLLMANGDSIDHLIIFTIARGGAPSTLGSVNIPTRAGYDGNPSIDIIAALAPVQLGCILLARDGFLGYTLAEDIVDGVHFDACGWVFGF